MKTKPLTLEKSLEYISDWLDLLHRKACDLEPQFAAYHGEFQKWRALPDEEKEDALSWIGPSDNPEAEFIYLTMWDEYLRMLDQAAELAGVTIPDTMP